MVVSRLTGKGHFKPVGLDAYKHTGRVDLSEVRASDVSSQEVPTTAAEQNKPDIVKKVPFTSKGRANLRIVEDIVDSVPGVTTARELTHAEELAASMTKHPAGKQRTPSAADERALGILARAAEEGADNLEARLEAVLSQEQLEGVVGTIVIAETFRRNGDPAVFDELPPEEAPENLDPIE